MRTEWNSRRSLLKKLAAALGGIGVLSLSAAPAHAGRSRWRGGYGGYGGFGNGFYRRSGRRVYGGFAPRYYGGGYGRFAPPVYGRGFYGGPYVAPVVPVQPYYNSGYYGPIMNRQAPRVIDALSLLEA